MWGTIASIAVQGVSSLMSAGQAIKMRNEQKKADVEAVVGIVEIYPKEPRPRVVEVKDKEEI